MKTIFILCDALKSQYLTEDNMPFLYYLSQKGCYIKQVIPCAGFCERSEIFTGLDGYDTGNFTAIGYLPENSPYKNNRFILNLFQLLKTMNIKGCRYLFQYWRKICKKTLNVYRIPYRSLKKLALTEDGVKQIIPHNTLFQVLDKNGLSYTLDGFTSLADFKKRSDLNVLQLADREIKKGTYFIPLYIGEIDYAGHRYGDDMKEIIPYLQAVDKQLQQIYTLARDNGYSYCVMGDHGMVPIKDKLDVIDIVKNTGCKLHKDYEAFYDSTMARFWFHNDLAKQTILNLLKEKLSTYGFIVDNTNFKKYRIPLDIKNQVGKPIYGDVVWCANPGVLISPDYFHSASEADKGMHGYVELIEGHGTGLYVEVGPNISHSEIPQEHSSYICEKICNLLEIDKPNDTQWKRII